jgi:hypothetical protein
VAAVRARSMQRQIPAIETSDRHHSSVTWVFLKTERIWVSVVQNSRECDCPGWGRRLVMAWMAAGLVEKIVRLGIWCWLRWSWATLAAAARAQRSASKLVAEKPRCRVVWLVSWLLETATATPEVGCWSSSLSQLAFEPRANTVRWLGRAERARMEVHHAFRSSPWRALWLLENRGAVKSSCQGGQPRHQFGVPLGDQQLRRVG